MDYPRMEDGQIDWCVICEHYFRGACELMLDCTYQLKGNGEADFDKEPTGFKRKTVTNADRIRAMTDEELAEAMLDCFAAFYDVEWSKKDILDWLRQEASE